MTGKPLWGKLTYQQRLDVQTALFRAVDDCLDLAQMTASRESKEGWNSEAQRYISAYAAIAGARAAARYRAILADTSRGNHPALPLWPELAPRHAVTQPRITGGVRRRRFPSLRRRARSDD